MEKWEGTSKNYKINECHCVKILRIRSFSGQHFPPIGLNKERYGVSLLVQSKCVKIRTGKTLNTESFHVVCLLEANIMPTSYIEENISKFCNYYCLFPSEAVIDKSRKGITSICSSIIEKVCCFKKYFVQNTTDITLEELSLKFVRSNEDAYFYSETSSVARKVSCLTSDKTQRLLTFFVNE